MKSLLNPELADLDKDGKLSSYEKTRGMAIEKSMREKKMEGGLLDSDMVRMNYAEGEDVKNVSEGELATVSRILNKIENSLLDDVEYDQMIEDLKQSTDESQLIGFRKRHSEFDEFIQNKKSRKILLDTLQNRDKLLGRTIEPKEQEQEQEQEQDRQQKSEGGELIPDEQMEEQFVDFVIDEALSDEEESMLMKQLEANPELSMIFDKVIEKASEFTGAGEVDGPGTGISDSIPARLSDGEFVFTAKAVKQIGVDNLNKMMDDAEAAFDEKERKTMQEGGMMLPDEEMQESDTKTVNLNYNVSNPAKEEQPFLLKQQEEDMMDEEVKRGIVSARPYVRS